MKKYIYFIIILFVVSGCSTEDNPEFSNKTREDIILSRVETEIVKGEIDFSLRLISECCDAMPGDGFVISPYSLYRGLSLLANATSGETLNEITTVLGINGVDINELNNLNKRLTDNILNLDNQVAIQEDNSAWANPSYTFQEQYANLLFDNYNATTHLADIRTTDGVNMINEWVSSHTQNKIKNIIDGPKDINALLINALAFEGKWAKAFKESDTKYLNFTSNNGMQHNIKTMQIHESSFKCFNSPDMQLVILEYGNGAYRMNLIMPKPDALGKYPQIDTFVKSLDYRKWLESREVKNRDINLSLPKFSFEIKKNLASSLRNMGINKVFISGAGGIDKMLTGVTSNELFVSEVLHAASIDVNEAGTKAQASSSIYIGPTDNWSDDIMFNRPFLFVIDEVSTGAILFAGVVRDIPE